MADPTQVQYLFIGRVSAKVGMRHLEIFYDRIGLRYGAVGLICTVAGYLTLYVAKVDFALPAVAVNATAFGVGLGLSFVLNAHYVFAVTRWRDALPRFAVSFLIAYAANLATLLLVSRLLGSSSLSAQFAAFTVYSVSFYLLNRLWSFKQA